MWQINGEVSLGKDILHFSYKTQGVYYMYRTKHTIKVDIFINVLLYYLVDFFILIFLL